MTETGERLTESEALEIQHLLHFQNHDSPVRAHGITDERMEELCGRVAEVSGVRLREKCPELFPDEDGGAA